MTPEEYFKKTGKRARALQSIDVNEISVVDSPAVPAARFLVVKSKRGGADMGDDLKTLIEKFLGENFDLAKLSEDAAKAIEEAVELLQKYVDDMPDDVADAVRKLAALAAGSLEEDGKPKKPGYGYPPVEKGQLAALLKQVLDGPGDRWPSVACLASPTPDGSATGLVLRPAVRKSEDDDEGSTIAELAHRQRRGMKKSLDGQGEYDQGRDEPEDLWPSL